MKKNRKSFWYLVPKVLFKKGEMTTAMLEKHFGRYYPDIELNDPSNSSSKSKKLRDMLNALWQNNKIGKRFISGKKRNGIIWFSLEQKSVPQGTKKAGGQNKKTEKKPVFNTKHIAHIYGAVSSSQPGIVKIGYADDVNARLANLYSTGVAEPFKPVFVFLVEHGKKAETAVFDALADFRTNKKREFFTIETTKAETIAEKTLRKASYFIAKRLSVKK